MVAPDYPGDEKNRDITPPPIHILPTHGNEMDSDDDNDSEMDFQDIPYIYPNGIEQGTTANGAGEDPFPGAGYQLLGDGQIGDPMSDDDENEINDGLTADQTDVQPGPSISNTLEREILQDIWNAPRPSELYIAIDANKSEEIKSLMSTVSLKLGTITPPEWAQNIPESKWIDDLLQQVRRQKNVSSIDPLKK